MRDLLHPRHRAAIARFVREGRVLVAFDYDGVLAPLVADPAGAPMRASTRRLLRRLSSLAPCAVVSGRSWRHTARLVGGAVPVVVGNHGFELGRPVQL